MHDHVSQRLRWLGVSRLIQFRLACVMYHQYNGARGIMFVPPIQFGNCTLYDTRTPPYYANLSRVRLSQTQKQVRYQGALVWNKLPSKLKAPMSYTNFYGATYTYFISDFCMQFLFVLCIVCVLCFHACMYCICKYACMYVYLSLQ